MTNECTKKVNKINCNKFFTRSASALLNTWLIFNYVEKDNDSNKRTAVRARQQMQRQPQPQLIDIIINITESELNETERQKNGEMLLLENV